MTSSINIAVIQNSFLRRYFLEISKPSIAISSTFISYGTVKPTVLSALSTDDKYRIHGLENSLVSEFCYPALVQPECEPTVNSIQLNALQCTKT